ncbi:hypothetical protein ACHQM5_011689 [Ranunculus cassubicifolius]
MARQVIVLALIFIALVGAVSAAKEGAATATDKTPTASPATESAVTPTAEAVDAEGPSVGENGETIGEDANAPTGELGPATAEALGPAGDAKSSSATGLKVSVALAGVAAIAGVLSF